MDDALRRSYDTVAAEYTRRIAGELAGKPLDRALLDAFAEQVRALGPACDLGCGPGHVGGYLAGRGLDVIGIDLAPALVAEARRLFPAVRFEVGNMLALPLADGSLGGVATFYSLIHLPPEGLPRALAEIRRVLVPRGLLLLAFHVGAETIHLDEWWGHTVSLDFHFLDPVEVRWQLEATSFIVQAIEPPAQAASTQPCCLGGARACPPEDCGGIPGYEDCLTAIRDPCHEMHDEMLDCWPRAG